MPYTQEELKKLDFYQNLKDEDEQNYLQQKALMELRSNISGSADNGSLVLRNEAGTVMVFENPYTGELQADDLSSKVIVKLFTDNLTNNISIDGIIDREFREL
tara:strand:- start:1232 stop:1540 length:309 start_codon:yes stop_codon:yes gene_type:complete